jgi:Xaa-Pro aminopeptidase
VNGLEANHPNGLDPEWCEDGVMASGTSTKRPKPAPQTSRKPVPKTANHDAGLTPELRSFMTSGWATPKERSPRPSEVAPFAADRRGRLSSEFPNDVLVVTSGRLKVRSNDTHYAYRANSAYAWLTGHLEEGGVLLMTPVRGGHRATLFVRPASGRQTIDFYRDRDYGELWVGPRPGVGETSSRLAIECAALDRLPAALDKVRASGKVVRATLGHDRDVDALLRGLTKTRSNAEFEAILSELRLIKDRWEIAELQRAVDATHVGFNDVLAEFGRAASERWLEGTFYRRARTDGNDVGYGSIVACGHHACTLHWTDNDGAVRDGDLALLDMGVEGLNLYTADVTRTVPINGTFSPLQRQIYDAVLDAQEAGIAACRDGESFLAPHQAAMSVLVAYLIKWGLLKGNDDELLRTETYKRYTLHGTSHMLGIDVHDCAKARNEFYREGSLRNGMVLTVEPGLYFQHDDLTVPKEFRGIGVRIEDDILITAKGPKVMSAAIPRNGDAVEQWVRSSRTAR